MIRTHEQIVRVRDFFDHSAEWQGEYYHERSGRFGRAVIRRMEYALTMIASAVGTDRGTALDAGCGSGIYMEALDRTGWDMYGCDVSPAMLNATRSRLKWNSASTRGRLVCADVETLPFPDEMFDLVLCVGVLGYLKDSQTALHEMKRVLAPGGYLLVSVENAMSLSNADYVMRSQLRKVFGSSKGGRIDDLTVRSPWMAAHSPTHYEYALYRPHGLEHHLRRMDFELVDHMTFGYQFRILRALGVLQDDLIEKFELALEHRARTSGIPLMQMSGDAYTGLFRKHIGQQTHA